MEDGIEVGALDESPTIPHANLVKYVRKVILHCVLEDV